MLAHACDFTLQQEEGHLLHNQIQRSHAPQSKEKWVVVRREIKSFLGEGGTPLWELECCVATCFLQELQGLKEADGSR